MFHKCVFVVLLTVTCVETLFIERNLRGDVIKNISEDECKTSENTEWKKDICACRRGYETAIVLKNKVECKNRSEILKLYGKYSFVSYVYLEITFINVNIMPI